jgi:UDPglucose--hexose-1-phosphate uridylyltransferase
VGYAIAPNRFVEHCNHRETEIRMNRFFAGESPPIETDVTKASSGRDLLRDPRAMTAPASDLPTISLLGSQASIAETKSLNKARQMLESAKPTSPSESVGVHWPTTEAGVVRAAIEHGSSAAQSEATDATLPLISAPLTSAPLISDSAQTHSRHDAITGRWTIFAIGRDERPNDFVTTPPCENVAFECPFCSGHENQTPPSVLEISASECESMTLDGRHLRSSMHAQDADKSQAAETPWAIRVIPNKFPAVDAIPSLTEESLLSAVKAVGAMCGSPSPISMTRRDDASITRREDAAVTRREDASQALFRSRLITGGHEVFIESPSHDQSIVTLDLAQVTMLFRAYQMRMAHWRKMPSICYVSLFKNAGPAAGASLHHSHSQLIATTELPFAAKAVADRMKLHWAKTGCCLQCDMVRAEIKAKERVVAATDSLIAYCPFGSHLPMLLRITTKRHLDCFESLSMSELEELARLVRRSIQWLQQLYPDVAYNYLIHTRPPGVGGEEMAHWALEIFPRVTQLAGFEWSSDCMINPMLPEIAAAKYREIARGENPLR